MALVHVALGANLGERAATLRAAFGALRALAEPVGSFVASPVYESVPMGPADQPDYLNAAARFATRLEPEALLDALQDIERAHGRTRVDGVRWGARTLDLDLLLYGARRMASARLTVPHPGLHERGFVLAPLADLDAGLDVPGEGTVGELLARVGRDGLRRVEVPATDASW